MVDFSALLRKPAGEAKKPPALPAGDYPNGVLKGYEIGDNNKNKTPYVRFTVGLSEFPESVDQSDVEGIDLSKRQFRKDYFLTDDALWRLDDLIRSLGIDPQGRAYEEVLPECVGQPVTVEVQQYMNQQTNDIGNQVGKMLGAHQTQG